MSDSQKNGGDFGLANKRSIAWPLRRTARSRLAAGDLPIKTSGSSSKREIDRSDAGRRRIHVDVTKDDEIAAIVR